MRLARRDGEGESERVALDLATGALPSLRRAGMTSVAGIRTASKKVCQRKLRTSICATA